MLLKKIMNRLIQAITIVTSLSMFACGGGGDTNTVVTNRGTVEVRPNIMINDGNSLDIAGLAMASGMVGADLTAVQSQQSIIDVTQTIIRALQTTQSNGAIVIAATQNCAVSGTLTIPDQTPATATVFGRVTFNNCNDGIGTINGTLNATGSAGDLVNSFTGSIVFNNLMVRDNINPTIVSILNDGFNINWNSVAGVDTASFDGMLLTISDGTNTVEITDFDFSYRFDGITETNKIQYTIKSSLLNGSVSVSSLQDIQTTNGLRYPFAGLILFTGARQSKARIFVAPNGTGLATDMFSLEVDPNGNGYRFDTLMNYMWSQI